MFKKYSKLQFWTIEILLLVLGIFLCTKISFIFIPIGTFISTLFFPILVSGFLYFLLSPFVHLLQHLRIPKIVAILVLYVLLIGIVFLGILLIGPPLAEQVKDLFGHLPSYVEELRGTVNRLAQTRGFKWLIHQNYYSIDKIQDNLLHLSKQYPAMIGKGFSTLFGVVTNVALTVVTVPFILFYMLKDGDKLPEAVIRFFPKNYHHEVIEILKDMSMTLSTYIRGLIIVASFVAIGSSIGYSIIGLPYGLLLGVLVGVTNIIPYLGPFLGAAPAVIIGLLQSPTMAILVLVVVVVVQQLDSHLISPLVIGKRLHTHPLTIIVLLLSAGKLMGPLGMILAVPIYAVIKTVILHIVRLVKLKKKSDKDGIVD